jgi:ribosome-associated translation inhibitor RaiA
LIISKYFEITEQYINNIRLLHGYEAFYDISRDNHKNEELNMHIDIQARDFSLTQALRSHVERRVGFALGTRYDQIRRIRVRLSDINGPRGGNDKCCRLCVVLPGQADVVIEDTQANLYAAIDRATDRAGRAVARKLARIRNDRRNRLMADVMSARALNPQNS